MRRNVVGSWVRQARGILTPPLTQTVLAARLQVMGLKMDQTTISKLEKGQRPVLDFEVVALGEALGVSVGWLLGVPQPADNETPVP